MTTINAPKVSIQVIKSAGGSLSSSTSNSVNPPPPPPPGIAGLLLIGTTVAPYIHAFNEAYVDTIDDLLPVALDGDVDSMVLSSTSELLIVAGQFVGDRPKAYNVVSSPWTDISDTVFPAVWTLGFITKVVFSADDNLVIMIGQDNELYVFDRSAGDSAEWTQQASNGFRTAYALMAADMINDQWNIDVKGDFLLIGRNATYTGAIANVPNAVVYDLTANPISEVTGLICAERSFNGGTVYCSGVSWHPIDNVVTLAVQNDNGIRTAVFTYDGLMVFTEIDNYISPEPTANAMFNCCFSPNGQEVIYVGSTSPYGYRYDASNATGNTALPLTALTSFATSRLCAYNELGSRLAFGGMSASNSISVIDTTTGDEVEFLAKPTNTSAILFT